jgi:hypothetical protein
LSQFDEHFARDHVPAICGFDIPSANLPALSSRRRRKYENADRNDSEGHENGPAADPHASHEASSYVDEKGV